MQHGQRIVLAVYLCLQISIPICEAGGSNEIESDSVHFCSFFNNRAPSPQPGLRNCTWFAKNSCCKQEEIEATFGTVKPLPGCSPECQRYTNYLMCYICAPFQNRFYGQERLTVCEEFCNAWYSACSSAILKGSVIGTLYTNGREFCEKRNFQCEPMESQSCFTFDFALDRTSGAPSLPALSQTLPTAAAVTLLFLIAL
ncbi:riboflavin-binding protein-like isoform X1 [Dreissena polymorpha]|uniref:riboflavin-binding protein-like isoform X1 n=1 Tax=Dreissena polymorpha TaxID=45954 RepID=UPI002264DD9E|nr:riboflavin-binding protein-like isoform X1 [Dreissena polymorpha]